MYPYIYIVLPSYSIMAFIGGLVVLLYIYFQIEKYDIKFSEFIRLVIICTLGVFIGSKTLFLVTKIPELIEKLSVINILKCICTSGYVFYGGLFGALSALHIGYRKNINKRNIVLCMITPAIPMFHAFGRIGCFFAGCCYGIQMNESIVLFGVEIDRIPVQLIESLFEMAICVILLVLTRIGKTEILWRVYLISYAIFRFVIEFFRGDIIRGYWFGLSTSQWISVLIIVYWCVKKVVNSIKQSRNYKCS